MEASRQCGADRRSFALAVIVVVSLPSPVWIEIVSDSAIGGLILRLQRARHLADIDRWRIAVDGGHAITGGCMELLHWRQQEPDGTILRRLVVESVALKRQARL